MSSLFVKSVVARTVRVPVFVLLLVALCPVAGAQEPADQPIPAQPEPFDLSRINGTWKPLSGKLAGHDLPATQLESIQLTIDNGRYRTQGTGFEETGQLVAGKPAGTGPRPIDVVIQQGTNSGQTIEGIIRLEENKLIVCYAVGEAARPVNFESTLENQALLLEYQRQDAPVQGN